MRPPGDGPCPSEESIVLAVGTGEGAGVVESHASTCPACAAELARLRNDLAFESDLRRELGAAGPRPLPDTPGYELLHELHRGGQGVVYRAVQKGAKRPAAVKLLLAGTLASARERWRFEREIEIASNLRHPNILTVYEGFQLADGRPGYAMELIDGEPIDRWEGGAMEDAAAWRRAAVARVAKVARAVQYAHARGVIHRDLKPGNILVDADGEPHVLDFGLARRSSSEAGAEHAPTVTLSGEFAGTPEYAAPEQIAGRRDEVDARADVYALGVVLYRLVCGRGPLDVSGPLARVFETILQVEPTPPSDAAAESGLPSVDADLTTILLKALAKDRERRYQTAEGLAQDLELYLRGEPIEARRDSAWYVLRTHLKRRKREAALAAGAAALLLAAVVSIAVLWTRAGESAKRESLERAQRQEQSLRAQAVALVLREALPGAAGGDAGLLDERLRDLRLALDTGWLRERPDLAAHVQSVLADIFAIRGTAFGYYGEVAARRAKLLHTRLHGEGDPRTLAAREGEAAAMLARLRLVEAEDEAEALAGRWGAMGADFAPRARAMRTLAARSLLLQGRAEEAAAELRALLSESPADAGPEAAGAWHTLAEALRAAGDGAGAREACERALRLRMALFRDADADVVASLLLLAELSGGEGAEGLTALAAALGSAEAVREGASLVACAPALVGLKESLFGAESGEVAESMSLLGGAALRARQPGIAAAWFVRAADTLERRAADLAVVNALIAAADAYAWATDRENSAAVSRRLWAIALELPASEVDPVMLAAMERDLALRLTLAPDDAGAEEHHLRALERFRELLGDQGHVVGTTRLRYALWLLREGRIEEAVDLARAGHAMIAAAPSTPRDQMVDGDRVLGTALLASGRAGEAIPLLERACEGAEGLWPERDMNMPSSRVYMVEIWWALACAHELAGNGERAAACAARAGEEWREYLARFSRVDGAVVPGTLLSWRIPAFGAVSARWSAPAPLGVVSDPEAPAGTHAPPPAP